MSSIAIRVSRLGKRFGRGRHQVVALNHVSFDVERADIFGFLGPNGAGKTTTIRILAGVFAPTEGTAEIDGKDVSVNPLAVHSIVGYMPESASCYPLLTGLENLVYAGRLQNMNRRESLIRARTLLGEFGLSEAAERRAKTYSQGMRKRLALARALLHNPPILLLDEPAGGLDPKGIRFFREVVLRLQREGRTIFLSSHLLAEVERMCQTVGFISRGRIVKVGGIDAIREQLGLHGPRLIEVECDAPGSSLDSIRALDGVKSASSGSSGILVEVGRETDLVDQITRILVSEGARIRAIRTKEASLEDAYVSLLEDESR